MAHLADLKEPSLSRGHPFGRYPEGTMTDADFDAPPPWGTALRRCNMTVPSSPLVIPGLLGVSKLKLQYSRPPPCPELLVVVRVMVGDGEARQEVLTFTSAQLTSEKGTDSPVIQRALGWVFRCSDLNVQHLVVTVQAKPTSGVASMVAIPLRYLPRDTPVLKTLLLGGFILALRLETRPCIPSEPTSSTAPIGCRLAAALAGLFHKALPGGRGRGAVVPRKETKIKVAWRWPKEQ
eukprot:RCo029950